MFCLSPAPLPGRLGRQEDPSAEDQGDWGFAEGLAGSTWNTQNHRKPGFCYLKTKFVGESLCFSISFGCSW